MELENAGGQLRRRWGALSTWQRRWLGFVGLLAVLVARYGYALHDPPYFDSVQGPFKEGLWLAENGFDYLKLAFEAPRDGGPAVYVWSIYPTIVGVAYTLFDEPQTVFMALHLLDLAAAAAVGMLVWAIVRDCGGANRVEAGLAVALTLMLPLFSSQIARVGMETLVAALVLASAYLLLTGRYYWAVAASAAGIFVKDAATVVACVNLVAFGAIAYLQRWRVARVVPLLVIGTLPVLGRFWANAYLDMYNRSELFSGGGTRLVLLSAGVVS